MLSPLLTVLPIFALILAGYLCRRLGVLGLAASIELNRYVIYLALPALLFDITADASWAQLDQPGFTLAYAGASLVIFAGVVAARGMNHRKGGRSLADAALDGLNAAYPNVGYMGFPLCLLVFGRGSLIAVTITAIVTVCVIFAGAIVLIEAASHAERNPLRLVAKVAGTLARNPLLVAPVLGAAVSGLGYHPAGSIETFFRMLGGSASPCALVALGLFLAERRGRQGTGAAIGLTAAKLVVLPVVTWALCRLLPMPPVMAEAAVLLAALPTGTGPFMLAEFYRREAMVTARTILASTVTSVLTLSVLIYFIRHGWL